MRTLSLSILTAGLALASSAAFAQPGPGGPPPGPPPGHTWHGGGGGGMVGPPAMGPNMGPQGMGHHGGGGMMMHGGMNFPHRIHRGFVIPPFWFGPQFQINNWQMYGFVAPGPDQRWVRYYDDAYLIDQSGRIVDSREGLDWDRYGEEWDMADGVPAYRGRGGGRWEGSGWGGGTYVYGGGYGYGAYAYPIVIETITTSGGMTYTEEVTEEVVQVRHRARRVHRRPRCTCVAPRPAAARPAPRPAPVRRPPPPGERG